MAYTTPRTWTVGEVVTAAQLNTHLRDNLTALKSEADTNLANVTAALNQTALDRVLGTKIVGGSADLATLGTTDSNIGDPCPLAADDLAPYTGSVLQLRHIGVIRVSNWGTCTSVGVTHGLDKYAADGTSSAAVVNSAANTLGPTSHAAPWAQQIDSGWIDVTKDDLIIVLRAKISFVTARPTGATYHAVYARTRN